MKTLYGLYPNPGSTSFKCREIWIDIDDSGRICDYRENQLPGISGIERGGYADAVHDAFLARSEKRLPDIVGFKAVHGLSFEGCYELDQKVMDAMGQAIPLAPLHNPVFIDVITAVKEVLGPSPFYAANFETAYARHLPPCARATGIPTALAEKTGLWRKGFHGNSHLYVAERAAQLLGRTASQVKVITIHIGGSSSIASRCNGHVLETSMGAAPESNDIPMGTRVGIYYGEMKYLIDSLQISEEQALDILVNKSGLRGLSGKPYADDLRKLYADVDTGDAQAAYAIDVFQYRLAREIGAQFVTMGGADALVFAGGMSKSGRFIAGLCKRLSPLGLCPPANLEQDVLKGDTVFSTAGSTLLARVETDEELVVAQACANLVTRGEHFTDTLFLHYNCAT